MTYYRKFNYLLSLFYIEVRVVLPRLQLLCTFTVCISISAFAFLVDISNGIKNSTIALNKWLQGLKSINQ